MANKESESKKQEANIDHNCIFSKENVNTGRQPEFDYYKTLNIFLMTLSHVVENFSKGYFNKVMDFLSIIFGAAGFMLLMGIGMKYSRHHDPKNYISRGIVLLTIGQYVNLIRNALPNLIAWWITGRKNFISRAMLVLQADVLTFSGIAFLFLALMKKIKLSDICILIISIIMNMVGFLLYKIMKSPNNFLLRQFLGYFILTKSEAFFPLFSYFIFVAFGYWLGGIYLKISNKENFYKLILIICFPTSIIYHYFRSHYNFSKFPKYTTNEEYILLPGPDAIASIMTNLITLAILYKIDMILKGKTPDFITHAAQNLNQYYILGDVFIRSTNTFLKATKGEEYPYKMKFKPLFTFMILIFCKILIDMNNKYIHFTITTLKNPIRNIFFSLIWIMTIISVIYIYPKVEIYATLWNDYLD